MGKFKPTERKILAAVLLIFIGLGFLSGCVEVGGEAVCRWYGTETGTFPYWAGMVMTAAGILVLLAGMGLLSMVMYHRRKLRR